jgi:outer membrane protein OmpA-like peptidoglycan-associated protein
MWKLIVVVLLAACSGSPKHAKKEGGKITVSDTKIEILDPIAFVGDTAEIAPSSNPMLDAVAANMSGEPSIKLVEIVVHGPDKALSAQRAKALVDQIVARKVAPERLRSSAGDEANVHVSFVILERAEP